MSWKAKRHRRERITRHHILPKVRLGPNSPDNLIRLTQEKHRAWHDIFGHLTFREAAEVLIRAQRMVERRE